MFYNRNFLRGQSGIELIILIGFFTFFFLFFLFVVNANTSDERWENVNILTQEIALQIQQEIGLAAGSISGYSRQFELPLRIADIQYSAEIIDNSVVYVYTADGQHSLSLPVSYVVGDVVVGANFIRNIGGVVYLNADP